MHSFRMRGPVEAPADLLVRTLTDCKEIEAFARHMGATTVRTTCSKSEGGVLRIEVYFEEPSRVGLGHDKATLVLNWDVEKRSCAWVRKDHVHGERALVQGRMWVEDSQGPACVLCEEGVVDIRIPLLGRVIGKKIAAALESSHPDKRRYWQRRAISCG